MVYEMGKIKLQKIVTNLSERNGDLAIFLTVLKSGLCWPGRSCSIYKVTYKYMYVTGQN